MQAASRYSGELTEVRNLDKAADALAKKLGEQSSVQFANDGAMREFDAVSDEFIAQAKPGIQAIGKRFRDQAKATFEAAKERGRKVYYEFSDPPVESVVKKLNQYSADHEVDVVIDVVNKSND